MPSDAELRETIIRRSVLDAETGCWRWQGNISSSTRYGRIFTGSKKNGTARMDGVHRVAYRVFVGAIPEGLTIDHVRSRGCRYRDCTNPAHLEPVTSGENVLRGNGASAQHARKTHCVRGHAFDLENTRVYPNGWRRCRACERYWANLYSARRRAAA